MKITRITGDNRAVFEPFLFGEAAYDSPTKIKLGVTDDDYHVAGAICAETSGPYFEILSLYVLHAYRRQGYGTYLLQELKKVLTGTDRFALTAFYGEDEALSGFFDSQGFDMVTRAGKFSFSKRRFMRSAFAKKYIAGGSTAGIRTINSLSDSEKRVIANYLVKENLRPEGWYDPYWSTIVMDGINVTSCLLCATDKKDVDILWFANDSGKPDEALGHIRKLMENTNSNHPLSSEFKVTRSNENATDHKITFIAENLKLLGFTAELLGGIRFMDLDERIVQALCLL